MAITLLILGILVGLLCHFSLRLVRRWAMGRLLDIPNPRSSHERPTPRGGGLAIAGATLVGVGGYFVFHPADWLPGLAGPCVGAVLVAAVSWIDDLRTLSVSTRLGAQIVAAAAAIAGLGAPSVASLPLLGAVPLGPAGILLTGLWIVGFTNAFNFMDGIDGIAAGQGVVAGLGWALIGWSSDLPAVAAMGTCLAASCGVFLIRNWQPASIFMGDVGSAFLGYCFAVLPLAARREPNGADRLEWWPIVGVLLVWPFVTDTGLTLLRRLWNREPILRAHRSHLYQRMSVDGSRHATVAGLYTVLAGLGAATAYGFTIRPEVWQYVVVLGVPLGVVGLVWLAGRGERMLPGPKSSVARR